MIPFDELVAALERHRGPAGPRQASAATEDLVEVVSVADEAISESDLTEHELSDEPLG